MHPSEAAGHWPLVDTSAQFEQLVYTDLLPTSSRFAADTAVHFLLQQPQHLPTLLAMVDRSKGPMPLRITHAVYVLAQAQPALVQPHFQQLWQTLWRTTNHSVRRHYLCIVERYPNWCTEEQLGELTDHCIEWMQQATQPVAIRATAIKLLLWVAGRYVDLAPELIGLIEHQLDTIGPGGQQALRKQIARLQKAALQSDTKSNR